MSNSPSRAPGLAGRGLFPLALLGIFVLAFLRFGPVGVFRASFPPLEELTIDRIAFPEPGVVRAYVVNGGPEPVTVAQVMVDEAFWGHRITPGREIKRLGRAVITIDYPWVDGEPLEVTLVTSTGLTFGATAPVATLSPTVDSRYLATFTLLGLYVGVVPVFIGLLWLPFLRAIPRRWLDFFLSLTMGLLVFLGVDALAEAIETSEAVAPALQGIGLVAVGLAATPLVIAAAGRLPRRRPMHESLNVAWLIALGIGLHNLGEGLAIGASYAAGEIALGTFLVLGFLLHNTTEGIGIVAPIAEQRVPLSRLVLLGAIAGTPTILGTWIGGFSYSPALTVLFLAVGAGAILQVLLALSRLLARRGEGGLTAPLNTAGLLAGLALMYLTGLLVAV
ncbi:MAG: ZIP family metal transporter [Gemmatimonadetes bacterium]|nr:ZIP family metal transporter [Gemmatimonadota bacterium]